MSGRGFLDVRTPFFRPAWRRALITGFSLAWAAVEASNGNVFWTILFGAAGLYLVWAFFIAWDDSAVAPPARDAAADGDDGADEGDGT